MEDQEKNKKKENWREKWRWGLVAFTVIVTSVIVIFLLLRYEEFSAFWGEITSAAQPIIIGVVIAFLVNPIVKFFEPKLVRLLAKFVKKEKRVNSLAKSFSIAITMILCVAVVTLLSWSIFPSVFASIMDLVDTLPKQAENMIEKIRAGYLQNTDLVNTLEAYTETATEYAENFVKNNILPEIQTYLGTITSGVISVAKGIINFILGILIAIYVLVIKDTLKGQAKKITYAIFRPKFANTVITTGRKASSIFSGFISGKLIDSFIVGVLCYIGCLILRIPQPLLIAVIIGVTNIIPIFGPFLGGIPSLFLVVMVSPIKALYLLIFILILQQVDGNIIGPKIVGDSTGLSSFWVMFATLVGGGLWGFIGMLIGVPLFATIYYIVRNLVAYGVERRNLPVETKPYIDSDIVDVDTNTLTYRDKEAERLEEKRKREAEKAEKKAKREQLKKTFTRNNKDDK